MRVAPDGLVSDIEVSLSKGNLPSGMEPHCEERSKITTDQDTSLTSGMPHRADESTLRRQLVDCFRDEQVHSGFENVFNGIPPELRGAKPGGQSFTLWRILEHLRLCVLDFLNYCTVPG